MTFKQKLLRVFFALEIMVFVVLYIFGSQGLQATRGLARERGLIDLNHRAVRPQQRHEL